MQKVSFLSNDTNENKQQNLISVLRKQYRTLNVSSLANILLNNESSIDNLFSLNNAFISKPEFSKIFVKIFITLFLIFRMF